jgi:hypothetical protein
MAAPLHLPVAYSAHTQQRPQQLRNPGSRQIRSTRSCKGSCSQHACVQSVQYVGPHFAATHNTPAAITASNACASSTAVFGSARHRSLAEQQFSADAFCSRAATPRECAGGKTAFYSHLPAVYGLMPYVVHATFQRYNNAGKVARFREAGAYLMDEPHYYTHGHFLVYDNLVLEDIAALERLAAGNLTQVRAHACTACISVALEYVAARSAAGNKAQAHAQIHALHACAGGAGCSGCRCTSTCSRARISWRHCGMRRRPRARSTARLFCQRCGRGATLTASRRSCARARLKARSSGHPGRPPATSSSTWMCGRPCVPICITLPLRHCTAVTRCACASTGSCVSQKAQSRCTSLVACGRALPCACMHACMPVHSVAALLTAHACIHARAQCGRALHCACMHAHASHALPHSYECSANPFKRRTCASSMHTASSARVHPVAGCSSALVQVLEHDPDFVPWRTYNFLADPRTPRTLAHSEASLWYHFPSTPIPPSYATGPHVHQVDAAGLLAVARHVDARVLRVQNHQPGMLSSLASDGDNAVFNAWFARMMYDMKWCCTTRVQQLKERQLDALFFEAPAPLSTTTPPQYKVRTHTFHLPLHALSSHAQHSSVLLLRMHAPACAPTTRVALAQPLHVQAALHFHHAACCCGTACMGVPLWTCMGMQHVCGRDASQNQLECKLLGAEACAPCRFKKCRGLPTAKSKL